MATVNDVNFDFRRDTPINKDPDAYSKTLKTYHRKLWSKLLPDGSEFTLEEKVIFTTGHSWVNFIFKAN